MSGRLTWLLVFAAALAVAVPSSYAATADESSRLAEEASEAKTNLEQVCRLAWRFDNLRPTMARAASLQKFLTALTPSDPMVHLSAASSYYRKLVGQIAYWASLVESRAERMKEYGSGQAASAAEEEIPGAEREFDFAQASYLRACAWAWPYANVRPLCHAPGFQPAEFLNPLVPTPEGRLWLSTGDPDYKTIVATLDEWEPKVLRAAARLKDLLADRQAAAAAAAAAVAVRGRGGEQPIPPDDQRLVRMGDIFEKLKPAMKQWRADQREIDDLVGPWRLAVERLAMLQFQAQQLEYQINLMAIRANNPTDDQLQLQAEVQDLQRQLAALAPQINAAQREVTKIEDRIKELRRDQTHLAEQADASMEAWVQLCDILGRLGPAAHRKALSLFDQWIAEEPRLWQPYLARAAARMYAGQYDQALADLKRTGDKLWLYDSRPRVLALITAIQAYALCKQEDVRNGEKRFALAKKTDKAAASPHFFLGWSNMERGHYSHAKADFQMALQLSKKAPRAEVHEGMAFLLATCPTDGLRNGERALEHATTACELTKGKDWICLDTYAAAHAEAGDFDSAIKWATRALKSAPDEGQASIGQRIALYKEGKPYRLKQDCVVETKEDKRVGNH